MNIQVRFDDEGRDVHSIHDSDLPIFVRKVTTKILIPDIYNPYSEIVLNPELSNPLMPEGNVNFNIDQTYTVAAKLLRSSSTFSE